MKLLLVVAALVACAAASQPVFTIKRVDAPMQAQPTADDCQTCISFQENWIDSLLNAILHMEIDTCGDLCGLLNNTAAANICDLLCDVVGIKAFAKALENGDIDVIYICQEHHKCPIDDNGAGVIHGITVAPKVVQRGSTVVVSANITVLNHTGTGEFMHNITSAKQEPVQLANLFEELQPGSYIATLQFATQENKQSGITWHSGDYEVTTSFCMGQCGSHHPHTKFFGKKSAQFSIKNNDDDDFDDDGM